MGFFDKVKDMLSGSGATAGQEASADREAEREEERTGRGSGYRTVTVRPGDTFSGIAARHGVDWREMARLNKVDDPDLIYPGQVFRLPDG